ncbi:hypothetical protein [Actinorugispora endophytica]|uniref:Uncharacterized protein n=1 Tax=Actinorugispora endophytica TaxID=1605990 RepID=A0A4R6V0V7_9ACTN|nr:hypothetical protein [Actinorugispora endophytica]TDQ51585.1 hypothetical protein EV190_11074 [Actinorugispora endophytica]
MVLNRRRARTGTGVPAVHLAGWLFADLLLVLFLISLSAQSVPVPPPPPPPPPPELLSPESCEFTVSVGSGFTVDDDEVVAELERILTDPDDGDFNREDGHGPPSDKCLEHLEERRDIGFVIAFGASDYAQLNQAREFAADATEVAIDGIPQFEKATYRELWTGGSPGTIELSLFFLE